MEYQKKEDQKQERTWSEEIEVAGAHLVALVRDLIEQGNVRRIIIRNKEGHELLEIPLTVGAAVGGVLALLHPVLVALGALAGLVAELKVEVVRVQE